MRSGNWFRRAFSGMGVALSLAVPLLVVPPPVARADADVRVLVVGDSITAGVHGDYTWRYRLWREFKRQGRPVDFVGSHTWPYIASGFSSATYADPNFDHDHFAVGGALLRGQVSTIQGELRKQDPDVVILTTGLNDLVHGAAPATVAGYLSSFIDRVRAVSPTETIIVSPVLPIDRDIPGLNSKIAAYDNLASHVVSTKNTATSQVRMAPTLRGWTPYGNYVQDGIHLTPRGDFFVAYRVAEALHYAGVLPGGPPEVPSSVAWVRHLRASLRLSGHTVVVRWDTQALTAARIWLRRRWGGWHLVTTRSTSYTRVLTPGATYDFRIQGVRRTMTSTNGPVGTIKAPPLGRVHRVVVKSRRVTWSRVYGASSYRVEFRKGGSTAWHVRQVRRPSLHVRATVVRVSARNAFSSSPPTTGLRRN